MKISKFIIASSLIALTGCGGGTVKETLGIGAKAPDEFKVVSRPPLSVPPQFNLRPPSNDASSPTVIPADKQAKSIITGDDEIVSEKKSNSSESQFMKNIGVDKANPKVREELIQQKLAEQEKREEDGWWSKITKTNEKKDALVNAKKEAERIKTNQEANKPITEGSTPEVKDKDHGVLGNIFGW